VTAAALPEAANVGTGGGHQVARSVIEAAYAVHAALGPGLPESVYARCLEHELGLSAWCFRRQVDVPIFYKGLELEAGFRLDLLVEEQVVVDVRAVDTPLPIHQSQLLTRLRLSGHRLGLMINFNVRLLKNGIHRVTASD
jgi:GxxExxY protein